MALLLRALVPLVALGVGSWVGLGRPELRAVDAWARPRATTALDHAGKALVDVADGIADWIDHARRPARSDAAPPKQGRRSAPLPDDVPYQTVDARDLPDPVALPRLNPEASTRRAWLLAEGPARTLDTPHRLVTLTFDDGPFPETTPKVLDLLARRGHKATFFLVGRYLDGDEPRSAAARAVARQIVASGHFVGNHTHDHRVLTQDPRPQALAQIDRGALSIQRAIGRRPNLFRPPYGQLDPWQEQAVAARNMELVLWSVEAGDMSRRADVDAMMENLRAQLEHAGGGVVLLHDVRPTSVALLDRLLVWLDEHRWDPEHPDVRGYEVVDLVTYMRATAAAPQPFPDRGALERARSQAWEARRPRHRPPVVRGGEACLVAPGSRAR